MDFDEFKYVKKLFTALDRHNKTTPLSVSSLVVLCAA